MIELKYEKKYWEKGQIVAGADEVGRGAFAGPVVAAAVVFDNIDSAKFRIFTREEIVIKDSKLLSSKQRKKATEWIKVNCSEFGIGKASVSEINKLGIAKATRRALRRAIAIIQNKLPINHLYADAFYIPYINGIPQKNQTAIVKGDNKVFSIAAASIIAKVYRDELMCKLAQEHNHTKYFWESNKGYGTRSHRDAIREYGITEHHRIQFVKNYV